MHYEILGDPMFRLRDVPRMLELATARADGDTCVPVELAELPGEKRGRKAPSSAWPDESGQPRACHRDSVSTSVYRAAWVCPIASPPIRDGWFAVDGEPHRRVGAPGEPSPQPARDLGRVAVLPGLVNAHTHLELSYLRGSCAAGR